MKRFFALVKNENIKTMKQTSYRVLLIIFAVIIVGVPVLSRLISALSSAEYGEDFEWYLEKSEDYRERGMNAEASYYRAVYEAKKFLVDHGATANSPGISVYEYESLYTCRTCTKEILAGNITVSEAQTIFYDYAYRYYHAYPDGAERPVYVEDWEEYEAGLTDPWDMENIKKADALFAAQLEEMENDFLNFDLNVFYAEQAEYAAAAVKEQEAQLAELRKELETTPKDAQLSYSVKEAELQLESLQNQARGTKLQAEKCFDYAGWERRVLENVITGASNRLSRNGVLISKEEYRLLYGDYNLDENYKDYQNKAETALKKGREAVAIGFYSIENNIPLPGAIPDGSVKAEIRDQIGTIVTIASLIMIVLAGSTLSNEYSSGTIRLLLIRPRKRSKILGSKIVSMMVLWIAAIVIALILASALDVILFGFGDVFVPDLDITDSGVITVTPSIVCGLEILGSNMLSSSVLIFFAFLLSTLVRRSALSIALPLIIQTVINIAQGILLSLIPMSDKLHFLVYTPLPYSDLTVFRTVNAAEQMLGNQSFIGLLNLFGNGVPEGFYPALGAVYLAAFTVLFIGLSFLSFTKQQIKN